MKLFDKILAVIVAAPFVATGSFVAYALVIDIIRVSGLQFVVLFMVWLICAVALLSRFIDDNGCVSGYQLRPKHPKGDDK